MTARPAPYPRNPWIDGECRRHGIDPAPIETGVPPMFAQCGEDYLLESLLRADLRRSGRPLSSIVYLDVGANHPVQTSNTYLFYAKYGCAGVLVEPNAELVPALQKARPRDRVLNLAVAPRGTTCLTLNIADHHELSSASVEHMRHFGPLGTVARSVEVAASSLDELLAQCFTRPIDILSIDIEGLDLAVLGDARLDCNPPRYVVIEHDREVIAGNDERLVDAMRAHGYDLLCETDVNFVFRRAS